MHSPLYVAARRTLLDAMEALSAHRDALVVIGAHAAYLRVPEDDLAVAPMTTDADIGLNPELLATAPLLADDMEKAGFELSAQPGIWTSPAGPTVDLIVPEALAGAGRRGARLGHHGNKAARRARGIEGCLVDNDIMMVGSLDESDDRRMKLAVAGPAGLIVAKTHKLADRHAEVRGRLKDKDALDIFRILRAVPLAECAQRFWLLLGDDLAGETARSALAQFATLFGEPAGAGVDMVVRATQLLMPEDETRAACSLLAGQLLATVDNGMVH